MSELSAGRRERLETLLAEDATSQLSDNESRELAELVGEFSSGPENGIYLAAAAIDLACQRSIRTPFDTNAANSAELGMPDSLRQRIIDSAPAYLPARTMRCSDTGQASPNSASTSVGSSGFDLARLSGWLVALAASILFGVIAWRNQPQETGGEKLIAVNETSSTMSNLNLRSKLLTADGTRSFQWLPGPTPPAQRVSGDVVWNQGSQDGYMSFEGLEPNDPSIEQYQLWIIDPQRDEHPIDGGVFDIEQSGFVVVPINAKLPVISPQAFAITIEKPGGVVVSDQSRLPLLANVGP
jgi:hypothetical protein